MKVGDLVRYKRDIFNEHVDKAIRERLGIVTRDKTHVANYVLVRWLQQQAEVPEYMTHLEVLELVEDNKKKRITQ